MNDIFINAIFVTFQIHWAISILPKLFLWTESTEETGSDRCNEKAEMVRCWWATSSLKRMQTCLHLRLWYVDHASNRKGQYVSFKGEIFLSRCTWAQLWARKKKVRNTYTKLLRDARLRCCCCCCCWGCCWETACCCCHVVGSKPPGDARACRAVMSALVSW